MRKSIIVVFFLVLFCPLLQTCMQENDTMTPQEKWKIHDPDRPLPPVVDPGPAGPLLPAPSDAVILFDGTDLSGWVDGKGNTPRWKVENGYMEVVGKTGSILSGQEFGDCQLHVEWASPEEVKGESQGRGNSGVFLMNTYEVQVLDCYDNKTYADGMAAAVYGQYPPAVNACRPPGEWQSFDIIFVRPRFDEEGRVVSPARMTVFHNGVLVQHDVELLGPTAWKVLGKYKAHSDRLPISLQDHGNPVRYRNIWIRDLGK
ncbi:MAG: DUF1080 domain-containing protein [Acidobacteria bacterium]|nr:DUF1080 domain-containing protein [Acidobacteriota bacterium]MBU1337433.1 DUF1080 domain-containing protein [Acidobacteriota bacterium]MBU1474645.1 DUF1080 domain-containing protein [Acidobacteriota bacterium]